MNLSKLNPQNAKAQTLVLLNPFTDEPIVDEATGKNITIEVLSTSSSAFRNKVLSSRKRGENESDEEAGAELMSAIVTGWSDNIEMNGKKLPYSPQNVKKLLLSEDWVAKQIMAFAQDGTNYAPKI